MPVSKKSPCRMHSIENSGANQSPLRMPARSRIEGWEA